MKVFHGSSSLPDKSIPKGSKSNGAFFTPQKEFSKIFGRKIFIYELDESCILDLRKEDHLEKVRKHKMFKLIELEEKTGLPFAFNHVVSIESLETVKFISESLGFSGAFFYEMPNALGIEIWDTSCLSYLSTEDNLDFDELNR